MTYLNIRYQLNLKSHGTLRVTETLVRLSNIEKTNFATSCMPSLTPSHFWKSSYLQLTSKEGISSLSEQNPIDLIMKD